MDLSKSEIKSKKKYWASLRQLNDDPEFVELAHKEFVSSPLQEDSDKGGLDRRDFMKLMAASTALASSACFQKPMHKILPYVNQPEEITFGIPNYYASTCGECATGCGILVKTREGRPIKVEGNPDHPMNKGALCARGQASVLNLYDPDRYREAFGNAKRGTQGGSALTPAEIDKKISEKLKAIKSSTGRIRILTGTINSPSTLKLINDFLSQFSNGAHVTYDPISSEHIIHAQELSYGTNVLPRYRFDNAEVIVSIDADFLGTWISPVEFTKQFTKNRKVNDKHKKMSKLFTFESAMTLTGSNADERVAIKPNDSVNVALAIANELVSAHGISTDSDTTGALKAFSAAKVAASSGFDAKVISKVAKELAEAKGKSLVIAGSPQSQTENSLSLQLAVNLINSLLQNDGQTIDGTGSTSMQNQGSYEELAKLFKEMGEGKVDALFIYKSNPAYTMGFEFEKAVAKTGLIVSFNDHKDETSSFSDFIVPDHHALENWGDAQPQKGLFSLVQPTIRPVYNTRSFQDSLIAISKAGGLGSDRLSRAKDWHEYLQTNWRETVFKDYSIAVPFDIFWESTLRDGVFDGVSKKGGRALATTARQLKGQPLLFHLPKPAKISDYELVFHAQVAQYDGSSANNPWLQEMPDPISRVTWDNYVSVSPKTSTALSLKDGDVVKVQIEGKTIELPALVQPGLHGSVIAIALGYGRSVAGEVGTGIGKNMFPFVKTNGGPVMSGFPVTMKKTGANYYLANIQEHHSMEGRAIVKDASLSEYKRSSNAGNEEHEELTTLWTDYEYKGHRWGMTIDQNSCTGCGACVIACQSENNVPVVGKMGVARGRIMHWIRIDRYYSGTPDNPHVSHQPMLCQHCENAPCETVCPVLATVHDEEGLNTQIYNRCVGTRYCANNCPYKVRRFNWYDYNYSGQMKYPQTLAQNPEVTVRSRGVMEKCSFCLQRIVEAKGKAKNLGRMVQDGDMQTACQQTCPGEAITFGNINDATSEVVRNAKDARAYHVLEDLNVRPSISYLTKIRNTENTEQA